MRIGVVDTERVVELQVDDPKSLRAQVERTFSDGNALLWVIDAKGREVGIPRDKIAFVEFEGAPERHSVGFAPND
ncbi:MAG: DUF3107 domain-containing protein [Acidimicrobiia bacterium]